MPAANKPRVASIDAIYVAIVAVLGSLLALSNFLEEKLSLFSILRYQHTIIGSTYKIVSITTIIFAALFYVFVVKPNLRNEAVIMRRIICTAIPVFFVCLLYLLYIDNSYFLTYEFDGQVRDIFRPFQLSDPSLAALSVAQQNKELAIQLSAGLSPGAALENQLRGDGWLVYTTYLIGAALMALSLNVALIVLAYLAAVGTDALSNRPEGETGAEDPAQPAQLSAQPA